MAEVRQDYRVALIVPVYNEEDTVGIFVKTVEDKLFAILSHLTIVFIDDGSKDRPAECVLELAAQNPRISLIRLSRNFGKEAAMSAALDLVDADALIPIDVDLQDPPELILDFIRIWQEEGVDTVYGVRVDRSKDTELKRLTSGGFYKVFNRLSPKVKIPENAGDFRLMDRRVVETVRALGESNRFMKALFAWPGVKSRGVPYVRARRSAGTSKWNYWKLWNFALDGIVSFSSIPLRVWSYLGGIVGLTALAYMVYILVGTLVSGIEVPGYASTMCVILFLGAVQLISIGVLGEYIGRMSEEVKRRPIYVVSAIEGSLKQNLSYGIHRADNGIFVNDRGADKGEGKE